MRSLYKLRLFTVILSKTTDFSDIQLSCWDFVADFALKHLQSCCSLSKRKPAHRLREGSPAQESRDFTTNPFLSMFLFGGADSRP